MKKMSTSYIQGHKKGYEEGVKEGIEEAKAEYEELIQRIAMMKGNHIYTFTIVIIFVFVFGILLGRYIP